MSARKNKFKKVNLICLLLCLTDFALSYELKGRVDHVSDGDTFLMITDSGVPHKVRLLHIDSPERGKPYYKKAKLMLKDLIVDKAIVAHCTWLDSYNRDLCDAFVGKQYINKYMVAHGGAWLHRKYYDYAKDPKKLVDVQVSAKKHQQGLWGIGEYKYFELQ